MNDQTVPVTSVSDGNITITLHAQVSQFPPIKPEDFYVQLMARYGSAEAQRYHFTIVLSNEFDFTSYAPRKLRDHLLTMFREVLDLPAVIEKYGRLIPKTETGQLRGRLYDCVARRFI